MDPNDSVKIAESSTGLWIFAIGFFVVGDIITTHVGLALGAIEANPNTKMLVENYGVPGMLAGKTFYFMLAMGSARLLKVRQVALLLIGIIGVIICSWNLWIIYQVA